MLIFAGMHNLLTFYFYYIHVIISRGIKNKIVSCLLITDTSIPLYSSITLPIQQSTGNFFSLAAPLGLWFFLCYCPRLCGSLWVQIHQKDRIQVTASTYLSFPWESVASLSLIRMSRKEVGWELWSSAGLLSNPTSICANTCSSTHTWPGPVTVTASQKAVCFQLCSEYENWPVFYLPSPWLEATIVRVYNGCAGKT